MKNFFIFAAACCSAAVCAAGFDFAECFPPTNHQVVYKQVTKISGEDSKNTIQPAEMFSRVFSADDTGAFVARCEEFSRLLNIDAFDLYASYSELANRGAGIYRNRAFMRWNGKRPDGGVWLALPEKRITIKEFASRVPMNAVIAGNFSASYGKMFRELYKNPAFADLWNKLDMKIRQSTESDFSLEWLADLPDNGDYLFYLALDSKGILISFSFPIAFERFENLHASDLIREPDGSLTTPADPDGKLILTPTAGGTELKFIAESPDLEKLTSGTLAGNRAYQRLAAALPRDASGMYFMYVSPDLLKQIADNADRANGTVKKIIGNLSKFFGGLSIVSYDETGIRVDSAAYIDMGVQDMSNSIQVPLQCAMLPSLIATRNRVIAAAKAETETIEQSR